MVQMKALSYKTDKKGQYDPICIPGCDACCSPKSADVKLTAEYWLKNIEYNGTTDGQKVDMLVANGFNATRTRWSHDTKAVSGIVARELKGDEAKEYGALFKALNYKSLGDDGIYLCGHAKEADAAMIPRLVDALNAGFKKYDIAVNAENINPSKVGSLKYCEVYNAPRSKECLSQCNYSAKIMPEILTALGEEEGEAFLIDLIESQTTLERFAKVNEKLAEVKARKNGTASLEEFVALAQAESASELRA